MDAAVHDEAVQRNEMLAAATRSSPSAGNARTRETRHASIAEVILYVTILGLLMLLL